MQGIHRRLAHSSSTPASRLGRIGLVRLVAAALGLVPAALGLAACGEKEAETSKGAPSKGRPQFGAADEATDVPKVSANDLLARVKPILPPLPEVAESADNPLTEEKITLGRTLYYDPRVSRNQDISCNTCHDLERYGIDVRERDGKTSPTSLGHKGQLGERNSPTVYNAAFHVAQFWDGRSKDVEEQAQKPILNPVEMAMKDEVSTITVIRSIPGYDTMFKAAFPGEAEPTTYTNIGKAIGAFERKLVTPSRYDKFLGGDSTALTAQELYGLQLFVDVGCTQCHNGPTLGGTQFQKLGSVKPWPNVEDTGRFKETKNEADKFVFKVPSLRNITETRPYLHNGSIETLEEVVAKMAEHQTARGTLKPEEITAIVAFLGSLKGDIPRDYIAKPELPPNGPNTPAPDPS